MSQLKDFPFAELGREIAQESLSGAVRLERDKGRAVVYFEGGKPVFAASNIKELRLGDYLLKRRLLSQEQLATLGGIPDGKLSNEIARVKLLDEKVLNETSAALVTEILRVVSLWTSGNWEFDRRARLAQSFRTSINPASFLLAAAREMDPQFIASRLALDSETISPVDTSGRMENLHPIEGFVLSRLDRPMPISELVFLSGQSEESALQIIYGLALSNMVQRSNWPVVLKKAIERPQPAVETPLETIPTKSEETHQKELNEFFGRLETSETHFEVLNVPMDAPVEEIKRTYYNLARRYHPDRFHGDQTLHARVEAAFARVTQAYETLMDPGLRATYESRLAAKEKVRSIADAAPPSELSSGSSEPAAKTSAEGSFREGYAALQLGHINQAINHLAAAVHARPNEPRYRAYYGKALAASGKAQRMAETEYLAAIKLEPDNASYHLMLAQLYYELTFFKRARTETLRALELGPNLDQAEARALLQKLGSK